MSETTSVTVDATPTARISAPSSASHGTPITFTLTVTYPGAPAEDYSLSAEYGNNPSIDIAHSNGAAPASVTYTFTTPGTYTVTLVVDDQAGGEADVSTTVTVS